MRTCQPARTIVALALVGLLAETAAADRFVLTSGDVIDDCWVVQETDRAYTVAVIRGADVGTMSIERSGVAAIERSAAETLDQALERAARARAERAPGTEATSVSASARRERASPTPTSRSAAGLPQQRVEVVGAVVAISPAERARLDEAIADMGETRPAASAPALRSSALDAAAALGPKAIPALTEALTDPNSYRVEHAARALAKIAPGHRVLGAYVETVPALLTLLEHRDPWVRVAADHALEGIANRTMVTPRRTVRLLTDERLLDMSVAEREVVVRWTAWWEAESPSVLAAPVAPVMTPASPPR